MTARTITSESFGCGCDLCKYVKGRIVQAETETRSIRFTHMQDDRKMHRFDFLCLDHNTGKTETIASDIDDHLYEILRKEDEQRQAFYHGAMRSFMGRIK